MLIWIDTETTGLDPETDELLEIALVVTDDDLHEVARFRSVLKQENFQPSALDDFVLEMHVKSGLIDDLKKAEFTVEEIEDLLVDFLSTQYGEYELKTTPLAGSSVGFDRAFLKVQMPRLEQLLSYRTVDVSSIKELANRWNRPLQKKRKKEMSGNGIAHRALDDILYSIEETRYYRKHLFRKNWIR